MARWPEKFYRFYWDRMVCPEAKPGAGPPGAGASWSGRGMLAGVVTQNIDGLHQAAGQPDCL